MNSEKLKSKRRIRRRFNIKKKIRGNSDRLRLTVYRSVSHIYAQIINDDLGTTLVSASTADKDLKGQIVKGMKKTEQSKLVGNALAKKAIEKNLKKVAFDRNGYLYHGRVKALADAAREAGLEF